eukprot:SAG31_NODE_4640_length_3079_cov_1.611409_3_plen_263_part_00
MLEETALLSRQSRGPHDTNNTSTKTVRAACLITAFVLVATTLWWANEARETDLKLAVNTVGEHGAARQPGAQNSTAVASQQRTVNLQKRLMDSQKRERKKNLQKQLIDLFHLNDPSILDARTADRDSSSTSAVVDSLGSARLTSRPGISQRLKPPSSSSRNLFWSGAKPPVAPIGGRISPSLEGIKGNARLESGSRYEEHTVKMRHELPLEYHSQSSQNTLNEPSHGSQARVRLHYPPGLIAHNPAIQTQNIVYPPTIGNDR